MLEGKNSELNFHASKKVHSQISDNDLQIDELQQRPFPVPKTSSKALADLIAMKRLKESRENKKQIISLLLRGNTN